MSAPLTKAKQRRMAMTAIICVAVVAGMTGLAFAAPPLYKMFCDLTGYGGTTRVAVAAANRVLDRQIEVRFDSNVAPGLPIEFEPKQRSVSLHLGETGVAFYRVKNLSDRPVTAVAAFNVTPHKTGPFFQKLECFCFRDTVIPAGAELELPVVFYVNPDLADDPNTEEVTAITLSYTYFRSIEEAGDAVAAAQ
jgi:cytochrome c oxidase assembly protein subunit 11